ncbi:MAG: DUF108 domain-containing protein [Candidatus Omnitrophica bacterium]|nr:DUF108 domain-containing protein [Candidatus Omnitrophota bacterium]
MPKKPYEVKRIGLLGCGAIGSALAKKINDRFSSRAYVAFLNDLDAGKVLSLAAILTPRPEMVDFKNLIAGSDIIIEAASASVSAKTAQAGLESGKDVLILSVGGLILSGLETFSAMNGPGRLFIPSGAVGGLDVLRAIRGEPIDEVVLKTRKPPKALAGAPYLEEKGIDLNRIRGPQMIFSGSVSNAVKYFPQNINVAAALAFALGSSEKLRVEIHCDPSLSRNVHEITASGAFGRIHFSAENVPSEDNPKTSRLAVLSALATLEQILGPLCVGT